MRGVLTMLIAAALVGAVFGWFIKPAVHITETIHHRCPPLVVEPRP